MSFVDRCRQLLADKVRRFRYEKWFWCANVPGVMYLVVFERDVWETVSLPYVAFLSIYALVLTLSGAEQAAVAAASTKDEG